MSTKKVKVPSSLLDQNVYLKIFTPPQENCDTSSVPENIVVFSEKVSDDGVKIEGTLVPYPYTPDQVASYADMVDYKLHPEIISTAPSGVNLGDITELQKLLRMDLPSIRTTVTNLITTLQEAKKQPKVDTPPDTSSSS